jgi:hypothetical protein
MMRCPVPLRSTPTQPSRLGRLLTQPTAFVCPPLRSWLGWHAGKDHRSLPCLSFAFGGLLPCLSTRVLTGSVTIGRKPQTR